MSKIKSNSFFELHNFTNTKVMVTVALFVAISIISGKFLAFSIGDTLRFSFENLTVILSGFAFGPVMGAFSGVAADLIGCVLRGYTINPILTFGAAVIGFLSGLIYKLLFKRRLWIKITVSVFFSHLIGSVIIKSFGLALFYGAPYVYTVLTRTLNYSVVFIAETLVLAVLMKNKAFIKQIDTIRGIK